VNYAREGPSALRAEGRSTFAAHVRAQECGPLAQQRLARKPLRPVGFTATITPQSQPSQAQGGRCPVLELVVGPLDLDLLGLLVNLNKVRLNVFAIPGQGAVGDRFCTLSRQQ